MIALFIHALVYGQREREGDNVTTSFPLTSVFTDIVLASVPKATSVMLVELTPAKVFPL